jgi:Ca-activated chloride channel family protein
MSIDLEDPRLTAYALGELDDPAEVAAVEALLAAHPEARGLVAEVRATGDLLRRELSAEGEHAAPVRDLAIHRAVEQALRPPRPRRSRPPWGLLSLAAGALILGGTAVLLLPGAPSRVKTTTAGPAPAPATATTAGRDLLASNDQPPGTPEVLLRSPMAAAAADRAEPKRYAKQEVAEPRAAGSAPEEVRLELAQRGVVPAGIVPPSAAPEGMAMAAYDGVAPGGMAGGSRGYVGVDARVAASPATGPGGPPATDDFGGIAPAPAAMPPATYAYVPPAPAPMALAAAAAPAAAPVPAPAGQPQARGVVVSDGQPTQQGQPRRPDVARAGDPAVRVAPPALGTLAESLAAAAPTSAGVPVSAAGTRSKDLADFAGKPATRPEAIDQILAKEEKALAERGRAVPTPRPALLQAAPPPPVGSFAPLVENPFVRVLEQPLSTFALDVDTASYAIVRRYLAAQNALPPKDAVRVEELVNAFRYDDPAPTDEGPLAVNVEIARSPWNAEHRLARVALTGRTIAPKDRPRANLVFLIDVSGSMDEPDKLPLLKRGMTMLTEQLGEGDRVAIVAYSNEARVVLPPTRGDERRTILSALEELKPGGGTNGAGGLELAYDQAAAAFLPEGANRVILASDGDFNVGETDNAKLVNLIAEKARSRVFLTVLGFGTGNLQDARLEALADKGNGQYHYIDSPREARRVLVRQVSGTLVTVAKDVKLQVLFNPSKVAAYRLIGYENRLMPARDFRDDAKDGGELGAGHAVSALYELVPPGKEGALPPADASRFVKPASPANPKAPESFVVSYRFKPPEGDVAAEREVPAVDPGRDYSEASESFRWAAAVASFGQILRQSAFRGTATLDGVLEQAEAAKGADPRGEREAFLDLVRKAKELGAR